MAGPLVTIITYILLFPETGVPPLKGIAHTHPNDVTLLKHSAIVRQLIIANLETTLQTQLKKCALLVSQARPSSSSSLQAAVLNRSKEEGLHCVALKH